MGSAPGACLTHSQVWRYTVGIVFSLRVAMPRAGELTYYTEVGEEGRRYALQKPFVDPECPDLFAELAFIFAKLPGPPARVLECGCGTGWLSYFLAKRGYRVTGQDVSAEALALARDNPVFRESESLEFVCSDFESLGFEDEYDAVVFCGSLHHAEDELAAIRCAHRSLKPGGVFLSIEPGRGHEKRSKHVIETYDVGDRDMPPTLQVRCGKAVGFREFEVCVHPVHSQRLLYRPAVPSSGVHRLLAVPGMKTLALLALSLWFKRNNGAVVMRK